NGVASFSFQAEDGVRVLTVTGVQTCALPIWIEAATASIPLAACFIEAPTSSASLLWAWLLRATSSTWAESCSMTAAASVAPSAKIGRASCRERVSIPGGSVGGQKQRVRLYHR